MLLLLLAIGVVELLRPRDVYTGSNSVARRAAAVTVPAGQRLCLPGLLVPANTGRVELDFLGPPPQPRLTATLWIDGKLLRSRVTAAPAPGRVSFAFPRRPDSPEATEAVFCVTARGEGAIFGGMPGMQGNDVPPTAGRRPGGHTRRRLVPAAGGRAVALLSLAADVAARAAPVPARLGRAMDVLAAVGLLTPALGYAAYATARRPRRENATASPWRSPSA